MTTSNDTSTTMQATTVETEKLTGFTGAQITGIDLTEPLSESTADLLRDELARNQILVIRDQFLTLDQQKALTQVFGPIGRLPYVDPIDSDDDVVAVLKEADEASGGVFGGAWHSDFSFLENPPAGSVLNAVEIPPYGGDTVWANQVEAYRSLPSDLKSIVDGRDAVHVGKPYGVKWAPPVSERANASIKMHRGDPSADREILHPAVITVPETGEKALFLNPIYTTRFAGLSEDESAPLLAELYKHASRPDFSYRHRWQEGDVIVWNNRTTLHYATNDYDGYRRLLYRTTFERPAPVAS